MKKKFAVSFCGMPRLAFVGEGDSQAETIRDAADQYFKHHGMFLTSKAKSEDNPGGWVADEIKLTQDVDEDGNVYDMPSAEPEKPADPKAK